MSPKIYTEETSLMQEFFLSVLAGVLTISIFVMVMFLLSSTVAFLLHVLYKLIMYL